MSTDRIDGDSLLLLPGGRTISKFRLWVARLSITVVFGVWAAYLLTWPWPHSAGAALPIGLGLAAYYAALRLASDADRAPPKYVSGEALVFLSDGRRITPLRKWIARVIYVGGALLTLGQSTASSGPAYVFGVLVGALILYWMALYILSEPSEETP